MSRADPSRAPSTDSVRAGQARDRPIVAIGELLWDELPGGSYLGGALLNAATHARRLGWPAALIRAVGAYHDRDPSLPQLPRLGVDATWVQIRAGAPTGTAIVTLDPVGSPSFSIARPAAYDLLDLSPSSILAIADSSPAAFVIGTLAQQSATVRATTTRILEGSPQAIRLYDVNLRDGCWDGTLVNDLLERATVIKLNAVEASEISKLRGLPLDDLSTFLRELAAQVGARSVCVTRGAHGARLLLDGIVVDGRPPAVDVADAVGAGDAFTAGLLAGILEGDDPVTVLRRALALGGLVAARRGAGPEWTRAELDELVAATPAPTTDPAS
jgi:fructokinase